MIPYWLLFALWTTGAVQTERRRAHDPRVIFFIGAAVATALMIGLRFEVGGDWGAYQRTYNDIFFLTLPDALGRTDVVYAGLNWFATRLDLGVVFVNLICAAFFTAGVARLAWRQPNPALAMLVGVPYLIIVVAMGYSRQGAAIGVLCLALADASEHRLLRLTLLIGVAALFHKTALIMLPVALLPVFRRNLPLAILGAAFFIVLYVVILRDSSTQLVASYVNSDYDSQGAAIRVSMNVVAAALFLIFRRRLVLPEFQKSFWTICSFLAFISVAGLALASASSGIDRISLYLIPLQLIVYARLPYLLSSTGKAEPTILIAVLGYSFAVQFVWLNYANNAGYWVPYKFAM